MGLLKRLKIRRGYVDLTGERKTKQIINRNVRLRKKAMKRAMPIK